MTLEDSVCTPDLAMLDKHGTGTRICITWFLSRYIYEYISNKNARYVIIMNDCIRGPPIRTW